MKKNKKISIHISLSVKELVEQILQEGDLRTSYSPSGYLLEGTYLHQYLQHGYPENSFSEYYLTTEFIKKNCKITISGKADGVIKENDDYIIDEIKSVSLPLKYVKQDFNNLHWAQAKCYAYIFCKKNYLNSIYVQLTYINKNNKLTKKFIEKFSFNELKTFFDGIINKLIENEKAKYNWILYRNKSIKNLQFPFNNWRVEQRMLSISVFNTIKNNNILFVQAPTGTGKTMGTLFPSIKSLPEKFASKIFYLTAKTTTRKIAEETINMLRIKELKIKTLTITAKEKICFQLEVDCDPKSCLYAEDYYNKLDNAIKEMLNFDCWTRDKIENICKKHKICPFEFSLNLALFADIIICDYNYLFDPFVFLKRFFLDNTQQNDYIFLIDEAHNLVHRARDMYSITIKKNDILNIKKAVRKTGYFSSLKNILQKINNYLLSKKQFYNKNEIENTETEKPEDEFIELLNTFITQFEKISETHKCENKKIIEMYFEIKNFVKINQLYDKHFTTYYTITRTDILIKIFCIDPSLLLKNTLKKGLSSIFFSATLTPFDYYINILGGDNTSSKLMLNSPFNPENLKIYIHNGISTKYKDRPETYSSITNIIYNFIKMKKANYFIFFPSYVYMNKISEMLIEKDSELDIIIQKTDMSEQERELFLEKFSSENKRTLVGMTIMGGFFGEGIDLIGDRLYGVVIVGVGLPKICFEREILKKYYDNINSTGFQYSYIYPGMLKVLQAVGRIIRTETDKGSALLIDKRFTYNEYMKLFPNYWKLQICLSDSISYENCRKIEIFNNGKNNNIK